MKNNNKLIQEKIKELEQQLKESNNNIDYDEVENYFKDEKNKTNNKYNGFADSNQLQSATTIDTAFAKALEYTEQIKKDNMSLSEIIDDLKKEIPKFKIVYERTVIKVLLQLISKQPIEIANNKIISSKFNSEEEKKLKLEAAKFWDQLNNIRKGLATAIAISAAAAAAFWALAWLGGISIPWAVAATTATAVMGLMLSSLNIFLNSTNPYMDKILQGIAIFENVGVLIYQFVSLVIDVFTIGVITLTGCSVLMPAFSAITAIVGSLYYWVASTDIFKQLDTNNAFEDAISEIKKGIPNYKFYYDYEEWNVNTRHVERNIELLEWTKYASSVDEFKKNSDNILFVNSKAFAGDDADFTQKDNILYKTKNIQEAYDKEYKDSIVRKAYEPWCCCWFFDELFFNIYIQEDKIKADYHFYISSNCLKTQHVIFGYEDVKIIL